MYFMRQGHITFFLLDTINTEGSVKSRAKSGSTTADYCPLVAKIDYAAGLRWTGIALNVIKDYINKWPGKKRVRWTHINKLKFTYSFKIRKSKRSRKHRPKCVYCPIPFWPGHISPCVKGEELWCCKHIPCILSSLPCSCWAYCEVLILGDMEEGPAHIRRTERAKNGSCSSWSWDIHG